MRKSTKSDVFAIAAVRREEEMNEQYLAHTMDRILAERLREVPAQYPKSLREAIHWPIRWIRDRPGAQPVVHPDSSCQDEIIARIRSLPAHMQEPLRRYFVFREAQESICFSIDTTAGEFRRFLRDAADYILMRHERMPELALRERQHPRYKR
jgi:hypothetical protein